ncbi:apolipoprotein L2-like isoform X2 [Platichthys flesus]|uniref:apolipoprotein L2-like isoform X2 n=1 Tax=Platichthys flesus TaxID=8260 RepID=UPI002DBD925D|nr:apolipoprotein L2-like isoform X2 [Platichthys flesus]
MSAARTELQQVLCRYVTDTLIYIDTVRGFCEDVSKWGLHRETELNMMIDIKERVDNHVSKSGSDAKLQEELDAVLKDTLVGLAKLEYFLVAVEKLAVTSLHVFTENQALCLPKGITLGCVQVVITVARLICPLLLEFKRDAQVFFLPRLQNVEVLSYELDKYIRTTQKICETLGKSDFHSKMTTDTVVNLDVDLSEDDMRRMLDHINLLDEIRMDKHFRLVFLFQEESFCDFISDFSKRQERMLEFLNDLEEGAIQLDRMNKGAKISSVVGSSVGAAGGVLSIVGLALIPFTAGVSLALTMTGLGMGITSGVNSAVTTATEIGVNATQRNKAREVFQKFMEDVQSIQECLNKVTNQVDTEKVESIIKVALGVGKGLGKAFVIGRGIDALVDAAAAAKLLKNEDLIAGVAKAPLGLAKSARAGFIALNALFLGMDIFFIIKDSISLAKGNETAFSQWIRARATLWSSEMDSWQGIHDSLCEGRETSEKKKALLETPLYPEMDVEKRNEEEMAFFPDKVEENMK